MLALAGLSGITVSADAFNIFVFMEISSLASYVLIAGGPDRRALRAVFKYLIMGTIGATFYLIGVGLIYMMTGTLNLADMELRIHDVADLNPILVAAGFITVGLALKAAVFPLHVWLPNAYTYAPHIVTVIPCSLRDQGVAVRVAAIRLLCLPAKPRQSRPAVLGYFLMPLAVLGILVGSAVAVFERQSQALARVVLGRPDRIHHAGCEPRHAGGPVGERAAPVQSRAGQGRAVPGRGLPRHALSRLRLDDLAGAAKGDAADDGGVRRRGTQPDRRSGHSRVSSASGT